MLEPVDMEHFEYIRMPVRERWAAVVPAGVPLAKWEYVTAKDLVGIPVIMPSRQKVHDEVASWFGSYYEKLLVMGSSNLSTNAALMVHAGPGYALIVEGALPFLEQSEICTVPLHPELTATSVMAWKRGQPFPTATDWFLQYVQRLWSTSAN